MNEPIEELLEYLKTGEQTGSWKEAAARWAEAVEQLQEEIEELKESQANFMGQVSTYARILDKGITVNVYQDGIKLNDEEQELHTLPEM